MGVIARSPDLITASLALLGASYAVLLAVDDPPLDARAAVVGAGLLAIGELAHLAIEARVTVARGDGAMARRVGTLGVIVLAALLVGGMLTTLVDLLRTGGLAVEILGTAAAAAAVGLLVSASRSAAGDPQAEVAEIEEVS